MQTEEAASDPLHLETANPPVYLALVLENPGDDRQMEGT